MGTSPEKHQIARNGAMVIPERQLAEELLEKPYGLKYEHRADVRDSAALGKNPKPTLAMNREACP
jgi:hypothetical protein